MADKIATEREQHTATLSTETKIYLDRSAAKKSGTVGSRSDCQKGRRGEVKFVYEGGTRTARVEWIKIQADLAPQSLIRYDVYVNGELRAVVVGQTTAQVEIDYGANSNIAVIAVDTADNESAPGTITVTSLGSFAKPGAVMRRRKTVTAPGKLHRASTASIRWSWSRRESRRRGPPWSLALPADDPTVTAASSVTAPLRSVRP